MIARHGVAERTRALYLSIKSRNDASRHQLESRLSQWPPPQQVLWAARVYRSR
jgi:hypothetical protein